MELRYQSLRKKVVLFFLYYGKLATLIFFLLVTLLFFIGIVCVSTFQKLEVSFLDIGQGDAIFMRTPNGHTVLIDGGGSDRVLEKLSERMNYFDNSIDVVISTHPDADHATGLISVLKKYDVKTVLLSPHEGGSELYSILTKNIIDEDAKIYYAKKGDSIHFDDGVTLDVIYPYMNTKVTAHGETNSVSVSTVVRYGDQSILLTGDLGIGEEKYLLDDMLPKPVTLYKATHHGSKYSNSDLLLSYIKPEYIVISAGKNNSYGHPHEVTLGRFKKYGEETLSTQEHGTISFFLDGKMLTKKTSH